MKKLALGLILGILLVGLIGVVSAIGCNTTLNCSVPTPLPSKCENSSVCAHIPSTNCINETCVSNSSWSCTSCPNGCSEGACIINPTEDCGSNNLSLCLNETNCETAGGEWKNAACVEKEENETEVQVCSTITNKTLCEAKKNCQYNNVTGKCEKITKIKKLKETLQAYLNSTECPEDCTCAGSTIKCETENGRVMTVVAGRSGNVIIITKTANASTTVILIKNATGIYGNFSGKVKKIKYLPDEIKERVLKKLKITNATSYNMTLKEDGSYEMTINGKYRVLWIFPKKTIVVVGINSETGEVIVLKKPWWKFRAD